MALRFHLILFILGFIYFTSIGQTTQSGWAVGEYQLYDILAECKENGLQIAFSPDLIKNDIIILTSDIEEGDYTSLFVELSTQAKISIRKSGEIVTISPIKTKARVSFNGTVKDAITGEVLIGATINVVGAKYGALADEYGKYIITARPGPKILKVQFIGYKTLVDTVLLEKNQTQDFYLYQSEMKLNEITVSSKPADTNISSLITGSNSIDLTNEGQVPYFLGEVDVIQTALLMPGIKTIGEDANGLYIRGGNVDQNLILMDEAPIYNPNHFYGLISVFNPELVNNVEILKGYSSPKFGGRASSVINVHQRNGDNQNYHFTGGVGLISAKAVVEGPIVKSKSSFILSARQSLLNRLSLISNASNGTNSFRDFNLKVNLIQDQKNTFFLAGYLGRDKNRDAFGTVTEWGNSNVSARWNRILSPRIVSNFSMIISSYEYKVEQPREAASFIGNSRIIDYDLKSDFLFNINQKSQLEFGCSVILHRLKPGDRFPFNTDTSSDTLLLDSEHGIESAFYINHKYQFTKNIALTYGFRQSFFNAIGSGQVYLYDNDVPQSDLSITDTLSYGSLETIKFYQGLEPRISFNFGLSLNSAIKVSYNRNYQYLHLISSTVNPSPTDIWKLSDTYIPPTEVDQFSLGYYLNTKNNSWEGFIEGYYKNISNTISYKNGADLLFNPNPETELLNGNGRAYGLELFIKKNIGKIEGWLSYTLSRSEERIKSEFESEQLNGGNYFPSDHDRTHFLSAVCIAELGNRWNASLSFNYGTGRPITLPVGKYRIDGKFVPHFSDRNQSRLPDYHRLDFSIKLKGKEVNKKGERRNYKDYWTFVLYNVYGRKNAYSYIFKETEDASLTNNIEVFSVINGIVPGVTYNFSF